MSVDLQHCSFRELELHYSRLFRAVYRQRHVAPLNEKELEQMGQLTKASCRCHLEIQIRCLEQELKSLHANTRKWVGEPKPSEVRR